MDNEFIINFTDITLNETDGVFHDTEKLMLEDAPANQKWVIRSSVTIASNSGEGSMEIQCHADGRIYILNYEPSIGELYYNPDIQALSMWAQSNGWKRPQPHPSLVMVDLDFWKHFYDTLVIDSDYLDKKCGGRPQIDGSK